MWMSFFLQKADPPKKPYVHPYRSEDGSFTTKEKDATFKGTGTTREEHAAHVALAEKHGFKPTDDHQTVTVFEKKRLGQHQRLTVDHAQKGFVHTITYPSGGSRQFKGQMQHMDDHMQRWA